MKLPLVILILELCGRSSSDAQIIDAQKNPDAKPSPRFSPATPDINSAISALTASVALLTDRLTNLEKGLHLRFQVFGEAIAKEKTSIETISSRLDVLDVLTAKVTELDGKVDRETVVIRTALTATNKDVQRLSTQLEDVSRQRAPPFPSNKEAPPPGGTLDGVTPTHQHRSALNNTPTQTSPEQVLWKVERVLPRLISSELNHFYLNMATKTDHVIGQLQRELVMRLRRIEATSKNSLQEIQETRQDTSHLTHIQMSVMDVLKGSNHSAEISSRCSEEMRTEFEKLKKEIPKHISASLTQAIRSRNMDSNRNEERPNRVPDKGGAPQPSLNSDLWKGFFSTISNRQSTSHIASPSVGSKQCLDPTAFATLEEVKQLLRSLMSKGEDLRRTLTKQATEGVDLLKLLHQRFSVLLRRINTEPNHGEALLAEVQELEHLVENSYSSILLAQNIFIESCRRIQQESPSIEGQIVEILNKLVTNIDLGHQFNRNQLREVRKLIQQMRMQDLSINGSSLVPELLPLNRTSNKSKNNMYNRSPSSFSDRLFNNLIVTAAEANSTEEKLQLVFDRISDVETELQTLNWNSEDVKNIIDELLTGAKDLKGYSRNQIESLQTFQNDILQFVDNFSLHKSVAPSANNYVETGEGKNGNVNNLNVTESKSGPAFDSSCLASVLRTLNSSTLSSYSNYTLSNLTNERTLKEVLKRVLNTIPTTPSNKDKVATQPTQTTTTTPATLADERYLQNVDQFYYDLDEEEMLMDDDHIWNTFSSYYDDEEDEEEEIINKKPPPLLLTSKTSFLRNGETRKNKAKMTVLEDDFHIN